MKAMNATKELVLTLFLTLIFILFTGCQDTSSNPVGSSGGNPATVTIQSGSYTNDGTIVMHPAIKKLQNLFFIPSAYAGAVSDFQFCITQLKVVSSVGDAPSASQEAILGLVNVSDPNAVSNWGTIELEEGATISEIHFEVHYDPQNCSAATFSASYNGQTLTKDLEFKFKFDPAISISQGATLELGLSQIAKAMEDAYAAGHFNDSQISNYLDSTVEGTGTEL